MIKLLLPIDGSEASLRAVDRIVASRGWYREPLEVHVLNVQRPLPSDVSRFIPSDQIKGFHHDEGMRALTQARAKLEHGAIEHVFHISVGEPGHVVAHYANELHCDEIVMTTGGSGGAIAALGSIVTLVVQMTNVPVLLVK